MTLFGAAKHRPVQSPRPARLLLFTCSLVILLFSTHEHVRAQDTTQHPDETIHIDTDLVTVPVVVTDGRGRRVQGLTQSDFDVLDDGRTVELTYFASGAGRVGLLFLLDASGSTRDILEGQREAALALFSRFGKGSRVSVISFQERPETTLPFTDNPEAASAGFKFAALPGRRTAIFDAALAAVRAFASAGRDTTERRIVILISDGLDTASTTRPHLAVNEALLNNVSFYVIHTPLFTPREGRLVRRAPAKGFRDLAEKTGGQFFVVGDAQTAVMPRTQYDLRPVFQAIEEDLRGQYVLGYYASDAQRSTQQHRIEVRLKAQAGRKLRVRALRESYVLHSHHRLNP